MIIIAAKSEEFFPSFLFTASIMVLKPISHTTVLIAKKVAFRDPTLHNINKILKITPKHKLPAVIHTIPTVLFLLKVMSSRSSSSELPIPHTMRRKMVKRSVAQKK